MNIAHSASNKKFIPSSIISTDNITVLHEEPFLEHTLFRDIAMPDNRLTSKHFDSCHFENCDFTKCIFESCVFTDCRFTNCNMTLIKIGLSRFDSVIFEDSKMIGIDWSEALWRKPTPKKKSVFPVAFTGCTLNYSMFIGMHLSGAKFLRCTIKEVGFDSADLESADFTASDLSGSVFHDTRLVKADFTQAQNYSINACINTISKARFSMPEATSLIYALDIVIE